ncbi:hypothetical protein ASF49_13285 [Methylobacterium sp. Leaf104]|uniref:hypothetical protein n=1 Tax=Methylobacterium TaxID=407 RepID=UPI0006F94674|nr:MULTISPECIES: hypothetical protein [Methylobacterium]KQP30483.1 hypothetical protein ASF49_13285 [Methylobacterium sp. Leaf104]MCI9882838.1 hypothetical protein [Methylobacterium goesingense]
MSPSFQRAVVALVLSGLPLGGPVRAQTASQITPPSFSPPLQRSGGGLAIPDGIGPAAPAGAERLSLRVGRLHIEGDRPAPGPIAGDLAARLSGRAVTVADLFAAPGELERA